MSCPLFKENDDRGACGVGFVVHTKGEASNKVLLDAKTMLNRMDHRGACACDEDTGDGAGVMTGIPYELYNEFAKMANRELPKLGQFATGFVFVERVMQEQEFIDRMTTLIEECELKLLFWRHADVNNRVLGAVAKKQEPYMFQLFVVDNRSDDQAFDKKQFETKVFLLRKYASNQLKEHCYICSLSPHIVVYKGMFTTEQLWAYYGDLQDRLYQTHFAMVHNRFSTNTLPSWSRAHPQRIIAHNGEINTLRGNVNFCLSRQSLMQSRRYTQSQLVDKLFPVIEADMSDSGSLDNQIEFLCEVGDYTLPEAIMMVIPEVWHTLDPAKGDISLHKWHFYKWAANCFEPWDGPALVVFSDGRYVGAVLDRNGLRPARYYATSDNMVYLSSEVGVVDIEPHKVNILQKGRLKAGRLVIVDIEAGQLLNDEELKAHIATRFPYDQWLEQGTVSLDQLMAEPMVTNESSIINDGTMMTNGVTATAASRAASDFEYDRLLTLFGYTPESISLLLIPMLVSKKEALGSMGNDAALACLSEHNPLVFDYFRQLFAQVTNPPIDPFRENIVMTLAYPIGPQSNVLLPSDQQAHRLWLDNPVLSLAQIQRIRSLNGKLAWSNTNHPRTSSVWSWRTRVLDATFPATSSSSGLNGTDTDHCQLETLLTELCSQAEQAVAVDNIELLVLSDRMAGPNRVPVPSLLALGAVHQHLLAKKLRMRVGLIVESGEVNEVHHFCTLVGFGADAICPYLLLEAVQQLDQDGMLSKDESDAETIYQQFKAAIERGIFKVIAKMGISTLQSYRGAQIFEAVGLDQSVIDRCFRNCVSRIGGADFTCLEHEARARHRLAYPEMTVEDEVKGHRNGVIANGQTESTWVDAFVNRYAVNAGIYHWRQGGEKHMNDPQTVAALQTAAKSKSHEAYEKFTQSADESARQCTLRGQFEFVFADRPLHISEIESAKSIVTRFATGAMSLGSISPESHTALAEAMNEIGARSNTGEGGEQPERYMNERISSKIKQVASARFGVNSSYLAHAEMLQIKMAQGAKPGEGGELPGYKVTQEIATMRYSVPGVGLISPPPHHDIYSIEDLAQLIYDLSASNPKATVSVKLVSEVGVGVIASGVAKARAAHITISGHDGGTGASSWTGIKHAGLPWELGIAETHQCLVHQHLRSRVTLQADGQMRTGRDVVVAALLGADEFAMSTAPLIVLGCTMMRKCHLNTCPVGIATQDPVLRKKFEGTPSDVVNYFFLMAEEIRGYMAKLGIRRFDDLIGRTEFLRPRSYLATKKAQSLDLSSLLLKREPFVLSHELLNRPSFDSSMLIPPHLANSPSGSLASGLPTDRRLDVAILLLSRKMIDLPASSDQSLNGVDLNDEDGQLTDLGVLEITNEDRTVGATLSYAISMQYVEAGLPEGKKIEAKFIGSAGQSFGAFLAKGVHFHLTGDANDYVGKGLSGGQIVIVPPPELTSNGFASEANLIVGNACLYGATAGRLFLRGQAAERFCVRNSGAVVVAEGVGDHGCEYMTGGRAVILGRVGRNFAAGMSGGIAFVYEPQFTSEIGLQRRFNPELVDLELMNVEHEYAGWLKQTISDFVDATGSQVGRLILDTWPTLIGNFVIIFPRDYRAALAKLADQAANDVAKESTTKPVANHQKPTAVNGSDNKSSTPKSPTERLVDVEDLVEGESQNGVHEPLDKLKGFVKYAREGHPYREVKDRVGDWQEVYAHKRIAKGLKRQAARCMDCGIPFCQSRHGCPLGNLIPDWNKLVFNDNWHAAHLALAQTNNFPEFTGRVCPAPCEGACVLGINSDPVTIKNIECAIADKAWEAGWLEPWKEQPPQTGYSVAVVGSGPAGLACADQLIKAGHSVTVIERRDKVGGLLRYGIPSMKLDRAVLDRRIDLMRSNGVRFEVNTSVGLSEEEGTNGGMENGKVVVKRCDLNDALRENQQRKVSAKSLLDNYSSVVLCLGSTWPRDLPIPGRHLEGIHFAMSFLERWQRAHQKHKTPNGTAADPKSALAAGKRVIVLGGGDTGTDCIATSLRQGATSIQTMEIMPQPPVKRPGDNPWPNWPLVWRVEYGHAEVALKYGRDPRNFNIKTVEFLGNEKGEVSGLRTIKIEWSKDPQSGRWQMQDVPNTEQVFECDLVLLAMGFVGPESALIEDFKLATNTNLSAIKTGVTEGYVDDNGGGGDENSGRYATNVPRVYAAGDCRRGQSLVVHAINEGRQVARQVDIDLTGRSYLPGVGGIVKPSPLCSCSSTNAQPGKPTIQQPV